LEQGVARMREGLAAISATGALMGLPYFVALFGGALAKAGEREAGLVQIERALATANEQGSRFQFSEMLRLKGELLATSSAGRPDAEGCFRAASAGADAPRATLS